MVIKANSQFPTTLQIKSLNLPFYTLTCNMLIYILTLHFLVVVVHCLDTTLFYFLFFLDRLMPKICGFFCVQKILFAAEFVLGENLTISSIANTTKKRPKTIKVLNHDLIS